jgi:hypothetical protein
VARSRPAGGFRHHVGVHVNESFPRGGRNAVDANIALVRFPKRTQTGLQAPNGEFFLHINPKIKKVLNAAPKGLSLTVESRYRPKGGVRTYQGAEKVAIFRLVA